jgi:hypothetical protein
LLQKWDDITADRIPEIAEQLTNIYQEALQIV